MILEDIKDLEKIDITKLEPGAHTYVIQVQIGDMSLDRVSLHLKYLAYLFHKQGITNAIFVPVNSEENGRLSIKELKNDN